MAYETAIVGNLALAEQWPRFSDTESEPIPFGKGAVVCSTAAAGGPRVIARTFSGKKKIYLEGNPDNLQLDFFPKGSAQTGTYYMVGETATVVGKSDQQFYDLPTAEFRSVVPCEQENQQTVVTYLNGILVNWNFPRSCQGVVIGQWEGTPVTKFGNLHLSNVSIAWKPGEKLETLRIQVRELYDEFLKWPGSYNQLLLSGSLDYCRSAINKLRTSPVDMQDRVMSQIRSYYSQCYGISLQYQEARSTLRRLNLQSLQDKFELLQEACASAHVYPRLEDLDPADIPNE
jgi:hypothetical protein